ncbi:hypothetical protein BuS5_01261 [Desulfosarcina sp. BuS5]|uniref:WecB/TagA/CpsF family glycosyltransferase n=1 Tax=Desulfosarcina sp. BuS5 TaxID=933262 RepID=UPI0006889755|nr:hypothetical protein [Desulfosarcina sp. BuS5]WDN88280.1 hypothetical protein BuS5_01248 [Desulfosarcina sp. BuS5]WDN88293.1 hypothetical protein BuS5_01261 [Desulfosarcina sp. BuS5]
MLIKLGKYSISNRGLAGDVGFALQAIKNKSIGTYMACANPHSLVVASKDALFESALKNADILVPDGTGIIIAAKILGLPCTEKVAGTDFFLGLSRKAQ